jgi:hypothetical protein
MENTLVFAFSGRYVPPEIEERYNRWYDAAYAPLYMKDGITKAIDRYKIIKKTYAMPPEITLYHTLNIEALKKRESNADVSAVIRDTQLTFNKIERFWLNTYQLIRSFRNTPPSQGTTESTIVNDSPIIHIEGYKLAESDSAKYDSWFNKLASRFYVPLLLKIPGVQACNFLSLNDYKQPLYEGTRFVENDMPRYMSIIYFSSTESLETFYQSAELAVFKRSLKVEFPGNLETVWDTEYQLFKSYRP